MTKISPIKDINLPSFESMKISNCRVGSIEQEQQQPTLILDYNESKPGVQKLKLDVAHSQNEDKDNNMVKIKSDIKDDDVEKNEIVHARLQAWSSQENKDNKNDIERPRCSKDAPMNVENNDENRAMEHLDKEKSFQEEISRNREMRFRRIVMNQPNEFSFSEYLVWPFCLVLIMFSSTIPLTLIPAHDLLQFPNYWYESLFHGVLLSTWSCAYWCVMAGMVLNINYILLPKSILHVTLIGNITWVSLQISSYYLWTEVLAYHYPIPFFAFVMAFSMNLFVCVVIWLRLTMTANNYVDLRKRMANYFLFIIVTIILAFMYQQIIKLIRNSSEKHQPFVALLFPVMRELGIALGSRFAVNCPNGDERGTKIFLKYCIASSHTITLCNVIGSHASVVTSWVLMGVDFIQNILLCLLIVWNKKRYPCRIHDQINALQNLAVSELVEFQAISFVLVIAVAYYGPNSSILGNVSNSYWAFNEIKDIAQTLTNMGTLFLVDFSSTLVGGTILWFCCQINLLNAFVELQKEFKIAFCVTFGRQLLAVCKNKTL